VEKFQNLPVRNANTNYRLQFHFLGQRLIIIVDPSSCGASIDKNAHEHPAQNSIFMLADHPSEEALDEPASHVAA